MTTRVQRSGNSYLSVIVLIGLNEPPLLPINSVRSIFKVEENCFYSAFQGWTSWPQVGLRTKTTGSDQVSRWSKVGHDMHVWMPLRIACSVFTCDILLIPSRHLPLTFDPDLAFWLTRGKKAQRQERRNFRILYTALLYICPRCVPFLLRFTFLFHFIINNLKPLKFQNHSYMIVLKWKNKKP